MRGALFIAAATLAAACNQDTPGKQARPDPSPAPGALRPAATLAWEGTEVTAFARAHREHRGVLMFACARWAGPCTELERTLADPGVRRALGGWIGLKIDLSDENDAAQAWQARHHADTVPYLGFFTAGGRELARIDSYVDKDELLRRVPPTPAGD